MTLCDRFLGKGCPLGFLAALSALVLSASASAIVLEVEGGTGGAVKYPGGKAILRVRLTNDTGALIPQNSLGVAVTSLGGLTPPDASGCVGGANWNCSPGVGLPPLYGAALPPTVDLNQTSWFTGQTTADFATALSSCGGGVTPPCAGARILVVDLRFGTVAALLDVYVPLIPAGVANWINGNGGDWGVSDNWYGGVPLAGEVVRINGGANGVDIGVGGPVPHLREMEITGDVALSISNPAPISVEDLTIGDSSLWGEFGSGSLTVDGGTVEVSPGAGGGAGLTWIQFGTLAMRGQSDLVTRSVRGDIGVIPLPDLQFIFVPPAIDLVDGPDAGTIYAGALEPGDAGSLPDGWLGLYGDPNDPGFNPYPIPTSCFVELDGSLFAGHDYGVEPGCSPGTLHLTGDFAMDPRATLRIEIGTAAHDALVVDGAASLDGTLELVGLDDPEQLESLVIPFLNAGSVGGAFSQIDNQTGVVVAGVDPETGIITTQSVIRELQCRDGVDNDGDGGIDFDGGVLANGGTPGPVDEQCSGPGDNREMRPLTCGLGAEVALILPLIAWLRRSRLRTPRG